ncbi:MAG TPA: DsbA family protein [Ferrovibrio sp.]|uniref:DsbA family protein n=1 Tax=Ferrovibrio sp. TaxID=1917215 RepID=UPI002ED23E3E
MKYIQRFVSAHALIAAIFALVLAAGGPVWAQDGKPGADPRLQDMVLGKADAPVTIIEYASMTCPHCAHFDQEVLPAIKTEFIDTGKVKLIFRDFPLDQLAFVGSIMARCAGPEKYFTYVDVLFAQQVEWATAKDPVAALKQIGRLGGMTSEQFDACLKDKALGDYILQSRLDANQKLGVNSTPTLIIDGKAEPGVPSLDDLRTKLNALVKAKSK